MLKMVQFRYYGENNPIQNNFPPIKIRETDGYKEIPWLTPDAWKNYGEPSYIKIQTLPGTKIYFNNSYFNGGSPIIIGKTGILELSKRKQITENEQNDLNFNIDLKYYGFIIDEMSRRTIDTIKDGYLIVTIIYE